MRRTPAPIARLLALVLLLQAVLAPALCIGQAQGHTLSVEICGPDGMRSMTVALDDEAPAETTQHGFCAVCAGMPQGAEALTPIQIAPFWLPSNPAWPPASEATLPPPARAPPQQPRAPPAQA